MNRKELTKTFMMISNLKNLINPSFLMVYTKTIQRSNDQTKKQYLLIYEINRYCVLALHDSIQA